MLVRAGVAMDATGSDQFLDSWMMNGSHPCKSSKLSIDMNAEVRRVRIWTGEDQIEIARVGRGDGARGKGQRPFPCAARQPASQRLSLFLCSSEPFGGRS